MKQLIRKIFNHYKIFKPQWLKDVYNRFWIGYPLWLHAPRKEHIVISLTSFPERFGELHKVIIRLLEQSCRPNKIVLYLDTNVQKDQIPWAIQRLCFFGLSIRITGKLIKPHKKYLYAMRDFPNSIIITVDDDALYSRLLIESLMNSFSKYPRAISACRVHKIVHDNNGNVLPYNQWEYECNQLLVPSCDLFATGVGGVLYPPHIFDILEPAFLETNIQKYCLKADDIWLKFIEQSQGIKVVYAPLQGTERISYSQLDTNKVNALCFSNVLENLNDEYIKQCIAFFGLTI